MVQSPKSESRFGLNRQKTKSPGAVSASVLCLKCSGRSCQLDQVFHREKNRVHISEFPLVKKPHTKVSWPSHIARDQNCGKFPILALLHPSKNMKKAARPMWPHYQDDGGHVPWTEGSAASMLPSRTSRELLERRSSPTPFPPAKSKAQTLQLLFPCC